MIFPRCIYVLLCGIHVVVAEVFSSVADLKGLLNAEQVAKMLLRPYVDELTSPSAVR